MGQIVEANRVEAPDTLVHRVLHGYARHVPASRDEQLEAFEPQFRPVAAAQVQRDLVLDAVAEPQELRATEAEIDERVAPDGGRRGACPAGRVYATLQKANRLPELERAITEEKVFDFLLSQSTVDEATS